MDQTAIKTISWAIHYTLIRCNQKEISIRNWEHLCGYLNIELTTIYNVEVYDNGFFADDQKYFSKVPSPRYARSTRD